MSVAPQPLPSNITASLESSARAKAGAGFRRVLASVDIPSSRRHLVARPPIEAIPAVARQLRSGIVIMGAISRSGLKRIFVGNTAERVLDELACDVLVVKPANFASRVGRAKRGVQVAVTAPHLTF
jgi:universal stress protein E